MKTILSSIYGGFLAVPGGFPGDFSECVKPVVDASVEVYRRMSEELLPTPAKSHYTFNLRDLSKVLQGILLITADQCNDEQYLDPLKDSCIQCPLGGSCMGPIEADGIRAIFGYWYVPVGHSIYNLIYFYLWEM